MNTDQQIKELHAVYCAISKQNIGLRYNRESSWIEFIRSGFTKADLEAVLKRLLRLIERGERRIESLRFSNVIDGLDRFEEELSLIKSEQAGLKSGERQMSVLDLQRVIEAKQALANKLEEYHAFSGPLGRKWDDELARIQFNELRREIGNLLQRIARMA